MRRLRLLILLLLLPVFAEGRAAPPSAHAAPFVQAIQFASSQSELDTGPLLTEANFARQRDLWIRVMVSRMPPTTQLDLSFITPDGQPFYETHRFFSRLPQVASTVVPGGQRPDVVYRARKLPEGYALDLPIAIAGSVFLRYPAPGTWTVQAKIGDTGRISRTLEVTVNPQGEGAIP
jgi:uncharacterized protein YfaP (DUF2135 family)